jgi:THO complex subunit 4
LTLTTDPPR